MALLLFIGHKVIINYNLDIYSVLNVFQFSKEFCPVECDWENEMICPGKWSTDGKEQLTGDFCMDHKFGECDAHCPQECSDGDMMCPGKKHDDGCEDPAFCVAGSKYLVSSLT